MRLGRVPNLGATTHQVNMELLIEWPRNYQKRVKTSAQWHQQYWGPGPKVRQWPPRLQREDHKMVGRWLTCIGEFSPRYARTISALSIQTTMNSHNLSWSIDMFCRNKTVSGEPRRKCAETVKTKEAHIVLRCQSTWNWILAINCPQANNPCSQIMRIYLPPTWRRSKRHI